jgi:putative serine protease PepD
VTDGWASPQRTNPAASGPAWTYPSGDASRATPSAYRGPVDAGPPTLAGPSPWWSDALADPWRDPAAPAAVVVTRSEPAPPAMEFEHPGPARRGLGLVLLVAAITALLAGALGGTLGYVFATHGGTVSATRLGSGAITQRPPDSLAGVVKKVLPSVVTIRVRVGNGFALGSGFIASSDGYVITNDHVVTEAPGSATVMFSDATTVAARVVGTDPQSDVAVLKVDQGGLAPVEFGDSDAVQVGDPVLAIGSPLALANTVTYGIISAVDRPVQAGEPGGITRYYAAIQTDAAINHGNSGGPLVDAAGRVIGVNSLIKSLATDAEQGGNVGLAFAIPVNQAKRIAQDIIDTGKARRTVIGAGLDNSFRSATGGVRLSDVESNGPAAAAGLRIGDVLVRIDGRPLEEPADLIALVRKYAPGTAVKVEYVRGGSRQTTMVTLAADAN